MTRRPASRRAASAAAVATPASASASRRNRAPSARRCPGGLTSRRMPKSPRVQSEPRTAKGRSSTGRAPVSKTGGCRFESCRPCRGKPRRCEAFRLQVRRRAGYFARFLPEQGLVGRTLEDQQVPVLFLMQTRIRPEVNWPLASAASADYLTARYASWLGQGSGLTPEASRVRRLSDISRRPSSASYVRA
jgi:hypothetical protein